MQYRELLFHVVKRFRPYLNSMCTLNRLVSWMADNKQFVKNEQANKRRVFISWTVVRAGNVIIPCHPRPWPYPFTRVLVRDPRQKRKNEKRWWPRRPLSLLLEGQRDGCVRAGLVERPKRIFQPRPAERKKKAVPGGGERGVPEPTELTAVGTSERGSCKAIVQRPSERKVYIPGGTTRLYSTNLAHNTVHLGP